MTSVVLTYGPLMALWLALVALTSVVVREIGLSQLKRHPVALAVLAITLAGLPAAAALKLTRPYGGKLIAKLIRVKSPAVALPAGCSIFPEDNIWRARVDDLPVDAKSQAYVRSIGDSVPMHADFGANAGLRYNIATSRDRQADVALDAAGESDPGPYRIPDDLAIEDGEDRHALVLAPGECRLYELFAARPGEQLSAGSGAIFDLTSNQLRPKTWTSADAAGLPIFPGLVRYDEVASGEIRHALRFTARRTQRAFLWPARHYASRWQDPNLPQMGQRFRLRTSFDISGFDPQTQVILTALKRYGMMLADNGGAWFVSGARDARWSSRIASDFKRIVGSDMEAVDTSGLMVAPDSGQARRKQ